MRRPNPVLFPLAIFAFWLGACGGSAEPEDTNRTRSTGNTRTGEIQTANELNAVRDNLAEDYVLMTNIDLSNHTNWQPIGDAANPFTGTFDGNHYNITNLQTSGSEDAGLFGHIRGAAIENLGLLARNVSATSQAGALVGYADDSAITNSYAVVEGYVTAVADRVSAHAGGLVGYAIRSSITASYARVGDHIAASFDAPPISFSLPHNARAGGLVGRAEKTDITRSYALVNGYIASAGSGSAPRSFASAGGLVGNIDDNSRITHAYAVVANYVAAASPDTAQAGGLVGTTDNSDIRQAYVVIQNYVSARAGSFAEAGGLVGSADSESVIINSYHSAHRSRDDRNTFTNTRGHHRTLDQLRCPTRRGQRCESATTYAGWPGTIWNFGDDQTLPTLKQ